MWERCGWWPTVPWNSHLNVCTGRGSFWLCPLICRTSLDAFLSLLSAASSWRSSFLLCPACTTENSQVLLDEAENHMACKASLTCFWASLSKQRKRASLRAQWGSSVASLVCGSSSRVFSSLRALSSSISCLWRVLQAWRSSSRSREVRVGCSAREERYDCYTHTRTHTTQNLNAKHTPTCIFW